MARSRSSSETSREIRTETVKAKRHPRKYYAARRMIAGERSGPGVEARTRGLGRGRA
jgi:hypothetical protein